ncbi:MAG: DNA polymerase IV [Candidatus Zixiibacteriota bacterium]|nr:MAG: DNA polymerase IV [candidate division Zixibacteria bacterium]
MTASGEPRIIMHVDMDAFFAAIEQRNNPDLRGKPVIVGGPPSSRGVVSTCSYEARQYGVHSAMPIAQAARLCPDGIFLTVDPSAYSFAARQIKVIFLRFAPSVEMVSVDEAFIDITGTLQRHPSPREVALQIKRTIYREIGITCSVGIGPNKLIAKLGSGLEKPDGLTIIFGEDIEKRLYPLPVGRLWGVGPVTEKYLTSKGIKTIGDLARVDAQRLRRELGVKGVYLAGRARGVDDSIVLDDNSRPDEKSISHEYTFERDTSDLNQIHATILALTEKVVVRMQKGEWLAGTVALRVRFSDFKTITRQKAIREPTDELHSIFLTVRGLLPSEDVVLQGVRLVGVRVSHLVHRSVPGQSELFDCPISSKYRNLSDTIKQLRDKFGDAIITRAGTRIVGR